METPRICVTIGGADPESVLRARPAAEADGDLVEIRLDWMTRPDPAAVLAGRARPVVITCRPVREGGAFDGDERDRLDILREAQRLGAEYVDLEWDAEAPDIIAARGGRGVIVSRHVFERMPADPAAMLDALRQRGGELSKLAVTVDGLADLEALRRAAADAGDQIVIGMGAPGLPTRILPRHFGSCWTYAGGGHAPGQIPAARLQREFRFARIRPDAAVYGVLGRPVGLSLSPAMHNGGFAALSLNAAYVPLETRDLAQLREFAAAVGLRGASVTMPFKQAVMPLLDDISPAAAAAGAVNTITIRDGRWLGTNTDAEGFIAPLLRRIPELAGVRALVLGAGGAARSVAVALASEGARVTIAARRRAEAAAVAAAVGGNTAEWGRPGDWDLLVNATPVGSRAEPGTPYEGALTGRVVYDLVYDPDPTVLMQAAAEAGREVIGGIEMLVAQAERQFEIWTGQRPAEGLFAAAAAEARRVRGL